MYKKIIAISFCTLLIASGFGVSIVPNNNSSSIDEELQINLIQKIQMISDDNYDNEVNILNNEPWSIEKVDDDVTTGMWVNSIDVDSNDNTHLVYSQVWPDRKIKYAFKSGGSWQKDTIYSRDGNDLKFDWPPEISVDNNNVPHVCFPEPISEELKYAKKTGGAWSLETVDSSGKIMSYCSITTDNNNNPHISYLDSENYDLKYAKWDGSNWIKKTVTSDGHVGYHSSITTNGNNNPLISYLDASNHAIKIAEWTGSGWDFTTVDSNNQDYYYYFTSIVVDNYGNPHVSYWDNSTKKVKYAYKSNSGNFVIEDVYENPNAGNIPICSEIDLDSEGFAHIVYTDYYTVYNRWDGGTWYTSDVDSEGDLFNSISLDSSNTPHISYNGIFCPPIIGSFLYYAKKNNLPPNTPDIPSGPSKRSKDQTGEYITSATDDDGDMVQYRFDWGNGDISDWTPLVESGESENMLYAWSSSGNFEVKAQAKDENGATSGWSGSLSVKVTSANAHGPYKGLKDYYVQFEGTASGGTPPYSYHWDFGDGSTSNQQNPQHTYTASGSYTAELTITDDEGTSHSDTTSVLIKNLPLWVEAAIILTESNPSWDGTHFHATIPFKNFAELIGINASVPGNVDIGDFSGSYDFNFDWDNTNLKVDLYPYNPDQDKITLCGSAGVDIEAYKNLELTAGVRANFEKMGDEFNWELCFNVDGTYEFPALKIYSAIGPVPVSAEANLHFDANAEFCLNSPDDFHNHVFASVSGGLGVGANVRGGIGVVGVASLGLYTDVGGSWNFRAPEQDNSLYSSFSAYFTFGAYAELIFVLDAEWEWYHASWSSSQMNTMSHSSNSDGWRVMPRNYGDPTWVNDNDGLLLNNAFPASHPCIGRNNNGDKMMVWAEDDKQKTTGGDGLDLWYSIWDKSSDEWKERQRLTNDNLAQSNPTISVLDNGHAICVFNCLTEPTGDRSVLELAQDSEIGYCYWDGNDWGDPQLIVEGGTPKNTDSYPVIKSHGNNAVVVWMCDENPDISNGVTINDRLLYTSFWNGNSWVSTRILLEDDITSIPVGLDFDGQEATCVYVVDDNGQLEINNELDMNDQNVYITTFSPAGQLRGGEGDTQEIETDGRDAYPAVTYLDSGYPAISWMNEDPDMDDHHSVDILFYEQTGSFGDGPDPVITDLHQGSSTALFGSTSLLGGFNSDNLSDLNLKCPVVAFSDGHNLCYKQRVQGTWSNLNTLHMSEKEITQTAWDYDGSNTIGAVFVEKDSVEDIQGCQMFEAGKKDMLPPKKPCKIKGCQNGFVDSEYEFETSSYDPTPLKKLRYGWDWDGDKKVDEWSEWIDSGGTCKMGHKWGETGEYNIRVIAENKIEYKSEWSDPLTVVIDQQNFAPTTPIINGPTNIEADKSYDYTFLSIDTESSDIQYYVEWGDGKTSGWTIPKTSGKSITLSHIWTEKDTYTIRAKAKDSDGQESGWQSYSISVTKGKSKNLPKVAIFIEKILNLFPNFWTLIESLRSFGLINI